MKNQLRFFFVFITALLYSQLLLSQKKDSAALKITRQDTLAKVPVDSAAKLKHDPHKATMRSLMVPGWGQAYNRKYWKIPLIYGALGITGAVFNFNRIQYNKVKYAYFYVINRGTADSNSFKLSKVDPQLLNFVTAGDSYSLQLYRNQYRKDIDYSVLYFLLFWALNVVDATVDGHLKDFDVSNSLSLKIKPAFYNLPSTPLGISFVLNIGKNEHYKHAPVLVP